MIDSHIHSRQRGNFVENLCSTNLAEICRFLTQQPCKRKSQWPMLNNFGFSLRVLWAWVDISLHYFIFFIVSAFSLDVLNNWNWAFVVPSYISRYGCHQLFLVLDVPISAGCFLAYLCSWYQLIWYKLNFVLDVPISSGWFLALVNLPLLCPMAQTHQKNNNNDNSTVNINSSSYSNNNNNNNSNMYHIQRSNPLAALIASLQPLR